MMRKRSIRIIFGILVLFCMILVDYKTVSADDYEKTCGAYTYVETEEGAWIVEYDDGKDYGDYGVENLTWTIPSTLNGLKVIGIGNRDYNGEFYSNIKWYASQIVLPDTLLYIGSGTFYECNNLKEITLPKGLTYIGTRAFYECNNLKEITLPEGLTYIGYMAFNGCISLESINIPSSVTEIDEYAFFDCWNASGIYVAEGNSDYFDLDGVLCEYYWECDEDGNKLQHREGAFVITCPGGKSGTFIIENDMDVDSAAFVNAKQLSGITVEDGHPDYSSEDGILYNKDKTEIKICPCAKTGKIEIPNTVTKVGYSAFSYSKATEIVIPDSVTFVDSYGFYNCKDLKKITIGKNLINKQEEYYYNDSADYLLKQLDAAEKLTTVVISSENSYMKVVDGIVYDKGETTILFCPMERSGVYVMPDTVTSAISTIFTRGFSEITIGASYDEYIGNSQYINRFNVSAKNKKYASKDGMVYSKDLKAIYRIPGGWSGKLTIPDGVTSIWDGNTIVNFEGSIIIPESVTEISGPDSWYLDINDSPSIIYGYKGSYAEKFAKEYNVPFVSLSEDKEADEQKVAEKGTVFVDSKNKYKVTSSNSAKPTVSYIQSTNSKAKTITIPDTVKLDGITYEVTSVASNALANNKKITKVTVGKNVTSVGKNAFKKCTKLKTITLKSASLKTIGSNAFYGDKKLKSITIKSTKLTSKSVGKNAFKGTNKNLTIKVPKKKVSAYKKFLKAKGNKSVKVKK